MVGGLGHLELGINGLVLQVVCSQRGVNDLLSLGDALGFFDANFSIFLSDLFLGRFFCQQLLGSQFLFDCTGNDFRVGNITDYYLANLKRRGFQIRLQLL